MVGEHLCGRVSDFGDGQQQRQSAWSKIAHLRKDLFPSSNESLVAVLIII